MSGQKLLEQIYDWLARRYPEGPEWNKAEFHCFRDCDQTIRAVVAMDTVEGEINNGAWGQLLWNAHPNWREVLSLAKSGYSAMGAAEQALAIDLLSAKLAEYESQCAASMARVTHTSFDQEFGSFTSIGYADVGFKAQLAFLDDSIQDKRIRWLAEQEAVINAATAF